jgi:aspartate/methionine/tyrosine aminotransferase
MIQQAVERALTLWQHVLYVVDHMIQQAVERALTLRQHVLYVADHMIQQAVERALTLRQHVLYVADHTQQTTEAVNTNTDYTEVAVTISKISHTNQQ